MGALISSAKHFAVGRLRPAGSRRGSRRDRRWRGAARWNLDRLITTGAIHCHSRPSFFDSQMLPAAWTFKPEIVSHKGGLYRFWNSLLDWQCSIQAKAYSPRRDPGRVICHPAIKNDSGAILGAGMARILRECHESVMKSMAWLPSI